MSDGLFPARPCPAHWSPSVFSGQGRVGHSDLLLVLPQVGPYVATCSVLLSHGCHIGEGAEPAKQGEELRT